MKFIPEATIFEWDDGNIQKNWVTHTVTNIECEQVFFDEKNLVIPDVKHSVLEERFILLGRTKNGRNLFVSYTLRKEKICVISTRGQNIKERSIYENQKVETYTGFQKRR